MEIGPLVSRRLLVVGVEDTLAEAARLMHDHQSGSAIVMGDEGPGIITERDILRAVAEGVDVNTIKVPGYMTASAITATIHWDVVEAAQQMIDGRFRHLIVLADDGTVEGMLSIRDLLGAMLNMARNTQPAGR
jgi:CBS domain-containing protein